MRFLRILPAVWAMISWSFSSFTRNVALGSTSLTVPGNSNSSSFAMHALWDVWTRPIAHSGAPGRWPATGPASGVVDRLAAEPLGDACGQLVAHLAIGGQAGLARTLHKRRVESRPILQLGGLAAGQLDRLMLGLGRQRDDQVE